MGHCYRRHHWCDPQCHGHGNLAGFSRRHDRRISGGIAYKYVRRTYVAAAGEIVGTGLIAPVVSALLVAPFLMGKNIPLLALIPSFISSTIIGALLGVLALRLLKRADII